MTAGDTSGVKDICTSSAYNAFDAPCALDYYRVIWPQLVSLVENGLCLGVQCVHYAVSSTIDFSTIGSWRHKAMVRDMLLLLLRHAYALE